MSKFLSILLLTLLACATTASAQTRPRGTTPAPARTGAPAQKPATTTTPAPPTRTPAPTSPTSRTTPPSAGAATVESCGCDLPVPEVLATVNGVQITKKDLSEQTEQRVRELQAQVVEARKNELNLSINSRLLQEEAKKRGISSAKLLEQDVVAKVTDPTDAQVQAFYDQNKTQIGAELKDVKPRITDYLREQKQREEARKLAERLRAGAKVQMLAQVATPPANAAERARVLAVVNDKPITSADIEDNLRPLIFNVQEQVYQLRRHEVELRVNDILLEQEAQKRKVTTKALIDAEVLSKVPTVTEASVQTFYNENKDRINGDFAATKGQIMQYLQDQESQKVEGAFADSLRRGAALQVFIKAPEPPVYNIAIDDQPVKGSATASVTLVEFTDYQCPSCAATQPTIEKLASEYGDRVRFVVRDYPLNQHENAFKAAEAAEAAREQGKYWEYTNILFLNQSALQLDKLKTYATQLGLDRAKFDAALDSGRFADKVYRDLQDGQRFGVNGTPTLFINGRRVDDRTYEGLKAHLESALRNSPKK